MSNLKKSVREATDELDAAGNTTAAIGKGFAIGSAALVALALFGAFITRVGETNGVEVKIDILNPYAFAALTMGAVGDAAQLMIEEIERQFPAIMAGAEA